MVTLDKFKVRLESRRAAAEKDLAKFHDRLTTRPKFAFEWADSAIDAAVLLQHHGYIISGLSRREEAHAADPTISMDPDDILSSIKKSLMGRLLGLTADGVYRSTSLCTNAVNAAEIAVCAKLLGDINGDL